MRRQEEALFRSGPPPRFARRLAYGVLAAIALAWHDSGAHRIDRDADGEYEDSEAIRIMDAWWPRLVEAQFRPTLGGDLYDRVAGRLADDHNRTDHLGSAFQGSAYGYVQKDLRELLGEPVRGSYSRVYCGRGKLGKCRAALLDSLREALQHSSDAELYPDGPCELGTDGHAASAQACADSVDYRAVGGITKPGCPGSTGRRSSRRSASSSDPDERRPQIRRSAGGGGQGVN